jgi:hypothetical protein
MTPPSAVSSLSAAQLCWVWRTSYVRLLDTTDALETELLTRLRRHCLDQLQQRDPVAFHRWFPTARAASDPTRFFGRQPQPWAPTDLHED